MKTIHRAPRGHFLVNIPKADVACLKVIAECIGFSVPRFIKAALHDEMRQAGHALGIEWYEADGLTPRQRRALADRAAMFRSLRPAGEESPRSQMRRASNKAWFAPAPAPRESGRRGLTR